MRGFRYRLVAALAAALLAAGTAPGASPFDDLLRRVPDSANFALFANIRALYNSPLGVQRNWAGLVQRNYAGGLTSLPPNAERLVVAQRLDPSTMQYSWRLELVQLSSPINAEDVARREQGTLEKIRGLSVVMSPRRSFFVQFAPQVVAEAHPADRQKLCRWLYFCERNEKPVVSEYLREAAASAVGGAQAVMAVDLKDMFDPAGVSARMQNAKWLKGREVNRVAVAQTLTGILGLQIRIQVDKEIEGEVRLDFSDSAEPLHRVAKDLILSAMEAMGASLDDMDNWQARVEGNAVVLRGPLTERGAKLLLSPGTNRITGTAYQDITRTEATPPDPKAASSMNYFRSVNSLLNELNTGKDTKKLQARRYWYEQYATKLDSLPMLNVDEELLQWGAAVSQALRQMAALASATRTAGNQITAQTVSQEVWYQTPVAGGYAYGPYAGGGWSYGANQIGHYDNYQAVSNLCAQVAGNEKALREQTWNNINKATLDVRRKMVQKYQVEF
jgi:hypothetical protein